MKKLIRLELRKIFSKRLTQLALAVVLLLPAILGFSTCQNKYSSDGAGREGTGRTAVEIEKEIAARYSGTLTDEKVQRMLSELVPKSGENGLNAIYVYQNTIQSAVSARFSDIYGNWNGLHVSDVFGDETVKIGYVDGWLSTSQNMTKVLMVFLLFIIVMVAPVFCGEYSGVDQILLSSKYGRTKCAAAKVTASVLAAVMTSIVVLAVNFLMASIFYGSEGLDCSILFAQLTYIEGSVPFNISCGTMLAYQALLAVTGAIGATGLTLIFSAVCKNQMIALVASAAVYALPLLFPVSETSALFKLIVLLPPYHAQFVSLMSVGQISGILLYAILAVPAAMLLAVAGGMVSRRIFARHQVL